MALAEKLETNCESIIKAFVNKLKVETTNYMYDDDEYIGDGWGSNIGDGWGSNDDDDEEVEREFDDASVEEAESKADVSKMNAAFEELQVDQQQPLS